MWPSLPADERESMFVLDLNDKVQKREREVRDIRAIFVQT